MAIAATASIATNTGAAALPESLIWYTSSISGQTGELEETQPLWALTLPGSQTWYADRWKDSDLEYRVDVTTRTKTIDLPTLVNEAGTVSATVTVKDEDGTSDTSSAAAQVISAISGYTRIYVDGSRSDTNGVVIEDGFTGSDGTALASHSIDTTNPWKLEWAAAAGTLQINDTNKLEGVTQNGAGYSNAEVDVYTTNVDVEVDVRFVVSEDWPAGPSVRSNGGANFIWGGIDYAAGEVQLYKVVSNSRTLLDSAAFSPSLDTDYTVRITDDGSNIEVFVDDVSYCTATESDLSGNTKVGVVGLGIGGASQGNVLFDNFKVTLPGSGSGVSPTDAINDIDLLSRMMDRELDTMLVDIAPGTYQPTVSIPFANGINTVVRSSTTGTKVVIDTVNLPAATPVFEANPGAAVSRRCTLRDFSITDSGALISTVDLSDAAVLDTTDDEIVVSAAFYAACSTEDPVGYTPDVGSAPAGMTSDTLYYVIKTGTANTIKLATSPSNALAGTAVNITGLSDGGTHHLVLRGRREIFNWNGTFIDLCLADIDIPSTTPDYVYRFIENTFDSGDRVACIRCLESNPKVWRYAYGFFGGLTLAVIDCGCGGVSTERPMRASAGTNRVVVAYSHFDTPNFSAKNPLRVQACSQASIFANHFEGSWMSMGGDGGDAQHVRIEQNLFPGLDQFNAGEVCMVSNVITDENLRAIGSAPSGADFTGSCGYNRNSGGQAATGRTRVYNNTFIATGESLTETVQVFGGLGGSDAANVAANVIVENNIFTLNGTSADADGFWGISDNPLSAVFVNNYVPDADETTGSTGVGRIDGGNRTAAQWATYASTSGTSFGSRTIDADYIPTSPGSQTIPNGVLSDFYDIDLTPGGSDFIGAVSSGIAAPTLVASDPANGAGIKVTRSALVLTLSRDVALGSGTGTLSGGSPSTFEPSDGTLNVDEDEWTLPITLSTTGPLTFTIPSGFLIDKTSGIHLSGTVLTFTINADGGRRTLRPGIAPAATQSPGVRVGNFRPNLSIQNDSTLEAPTETFNVRPGSEVAFDDTGDDYEIRYTTNNRTPTSKSKLYSGSIRLDRNLTGSDNTVIKARIFHKNNPNIKSRTTKITVRVV